MSEYLINITSDTKDSEGRYLLGDNEIHSTTYYDARGEVWTRSYDGVVNPFSNSDFSQPTITGTNQWQVSETNFLVQQFKVPFAYGNSLFANKAEIESFSTLEGGGVADTLVDYFNAAVSTTQSAPRSEFPLDFDSDYYPEGFLTSSGLDNDAFIELDFGANQEVAGFLIDQPYLAGVDELDPSKWLRTYEIQVSTTTNDGVGYSTVASGTVDYGWMNPVWVEITPTQARYVKLLFRNHGYNGDVQKIGIHRFFAYSQEDISNGFGLMVREHYSYGYAGNNNHADWALQQNVDLSDIDWFYFDVKDFAREPQYALEVYVDGQKRFDFGGSNNNSYIYQKNLGVDVSSFTGNSTVELRKPYGERVSPEDGASLSLFTNFSVIPDWYSEIDSDKRGSKKEFPEETYLVSDAKGLSIIDASDNSLWMRFDYGHRKMLQHRPTKVLAKSGKIYFSTFRGIYVIDFSKNCCFRFDERGEFLRSSIGSRNADGFDFDERRLTPQQNLTDYFEVEASNKLPANAVYDAHLSENKLVLSTNNGLIIFDDSTNTFYSSVDTRPVEQLVSVEDSVWYVQGTGSAASLRFIESVESKSDRFSPDEIYHQEVSIPNALAASGTLHQDWSVVNNDPAMSVEVGDYITISGTHTEGGPSGVVCDIPFAGRSFNAKAKVRIKDFPGDARGALRFAIVDDYFDRGVLGLKGERSGLERTGISLSAFNYDIHGPFLVENNLLQKGSFEDYPYWVPAINNKYMGDMYLLPTSSGMSAVCTNFIEDTGDAPEKNYKVLPFVSTLPFEKRDFTARVDVKVESDFQVTYNSPSRNNAIFFGLTSKDLFPGVSGTTDAVSAAMVLGGDTTLSGVHLYGVGKFAEDYRLLSANTYFTDIAIGSGEGLPGAPFREWRFDYQGGKNQLTAFIDGQEVSTYTFSWDDPDDLDAPPLQQIIFGLYTQGENALRPACGFKNFRVEYPPLIEDSRYKYGIETVGYKGNWQGEVVPFTTFSGISAAGNTDPANTTLAENGTLSDADLHSGGVTISSGTSVGIGLDASKAIEGLYLYDIYPETNKWSAFGEDEEHLVEVWSSEDNSTWNFEKEIDLRNVARSQGKIELKFSSAIKARFLQILAVRPTVNYEVRDDPNNDTSRADWVVSGVEPVTVSGTNFAASDATSSANFRDWELSYNADSGEVKGYIDGNLVSSGTYGRSLTSGKLAFLHDLTPVSSGTDKFFHADVKDFEINFSDSPKIISGGVDGLAVTKNVIGGDNYTVITTSVSGVGIADMERGPGATLPDEFKKFDYTQIKGEAGYAPVAFADEGAHRDSGLVFVGTNSLKSSYFRSDFSRPYWFNAWVPTYFSAETPSTTEGIEYGSNTFIQYIPEQDKYLTVFDGIHSLFIVVDFELGHYYYVPRDFYAEAFGLSPTEEFHARGLPKTTFDPLSSKVWFYASIDRLALLDVFGGSAEAFSPAIPLDNDFSALNTVSYCLHNHRLVYSWEYLGQVDAVKSLQLDPPDHSNSFKRWNRGNSLPWYISGGISFNKGNADSAYSEYDKKVYILGRAASDFGSDVYFASYDPDKDYLRVINKLDPEVTWPTVSGSIPSAKWAGTSSLVYDPELHRIYAFSAEGSVGEVFYFDIPKQEWVYTGEDAPYNCRTGGSLNAGENPTTNFATYDSKRRAVTLLNTTDDGNIYQYFLPERGSTPRLDYRPVAHGLPSDAEQFTSFQDVLKESYSEQDQLEQDFYHSHRDSASGYDISVSNGVVVVSGTNPSTLGSHVRDYWVSTMSTGVTSGFDLSAQIAFPKFTKDIYRDNDNQDEHAYARFVFGVADGVHMPWVLPDVGDEDPDMYQAVDVRAAVSGTINDNSTEFPIIGHLHYVDGMNKQQSFHSLPLRTFHSFDSGLDLGDSPISFQEFRLIYEYEDDTVTAYIGGNVVGTTKLKRKFDQNGLRVYFGWESNSDSDELEGHEWEAQLKDFSFTPRGWDYIDSSRLVTTISGAIGDYYHEKFDSTIRKDRDWILETDVYLPTSFRFDGYSYVCTLAGIGDGNKLFELDAVYRGNRKYIGIPADLDSRHSFDSYLATKEHFWDDIEKGMYKIVRDTTTDTVSLYLDGESSPTFTVSYDDLPDYDYQKVYYGKVNYGDWEKVSTFTTVTGTWVTTPDTSSSTDPVPGKVLFGSEGYFATVGQGSDAEAEADLGVGLGEVDLYVFYQAQSKDAAFDAPYTVYADSLKQAPSGDPIVSTSTASPYTVVRVDQRKTSEGNFASADPEKAESSGWVYIGRYENPTKVSLTADATNDTSETEGFVCANAVGIDIGKYGKSTATLSLKRFRYDTGRKEFLSDKVTSGVSVIDLSTNTVIDFYGEETTPALIDGDISSGDTVE